MIKSMIYDSMIIFTDFNENNLVDFSMWPSKEVEFNFFLEIFI